MQNSNIKIAWSQLLKSKGFTVLVSMVWSLRSGLLEDAAKAIKNAKTILVIEGKSGDKNRISHGQASEERPCLCLKQHAGRPGQICPLSPGEKWE